MTLRRLHRVGALLLAAFIVAHLGNHLMIAISAEMHLKTQALLRVMYRAPFVEPLLIILLSVHVVTGIRLVVRRGWPKSRWLQIQTLSGLYIAFFLIQHVAAVFATRAFYPEVDTNTYWSAAVVSQAPHIFYFAPYYAFGVIALFTHVASILRRSQTGRRVAPLIGWSGVPVAVMIVAGFAGALYPIELPEAYQAYLDSYWGLAPRR